MQDSIFTKIIKGEIPCYKIYEDEKTIAFLDINPVRTGHVLVVPKVQIDKFYDLPDDEYSYLFKVAKKIAKHMESVFGERILLKIVGTDVPHTHIHLIPLDPDYDERQPDKKVELTDQQFKELANKLNIK